MTISSSNKRNSYSGDDTTVSFYYTFKIFNENHLTVTLVASDGTETTQIKTTNYTVSGVGADGGGSILMGTAPATGEMLVITRNMTFLQETDYVENDAFPAAATEDALDSLVMTDQQLQEAIDRCAKVAIGQNIDVTLPTPSANKAIAWNATADGFINTDVDAASISAAQAAAEAAATAAAASETAAATSETDAEASAATSALYGISALLYLANNYI